MNLMYFLLVWYGFEALITSQFYVQLPSNIVSLAKKVDEIIILLMLMKIIINYFNLQKYINSSFKKCSFSFIFIVCLSGLINFVSIPIILEYIIRYGKWIIIVFYSHMTIRWNEFHYYKFWKYLNIYFITQFLINALWYFNIVLIPNIKIHHSFDWALGTMGHSFYVALLSSIILSGHMYVIMKFRRRSLKLIYSYAFIILSIIQILWTNTNHLVLIIPVLLMIVIFILPIIKIRYKISFLSLAVFLFFNTIININANDLFKSGIERLKYSPKAVTYYHSFVTIPSEVLIAALGAGPGNAGSFIGKENETAIALKYFVKYDVPEIRFGSILTVPYTGLNSIQSELGFFGTTIIIFLSFRLLIILFRKNKINIRYFPFNYRSLITFVSFFFFLLFVTENLLGDFLQHSFFPILTWFLIAISIKKEPLS